MESSFSTRLKQLRVMYNMKQSEFAKSLETTQGNISYMEQGETLPTGQFMQRLTERYPEINLNWLMSNRGNPTLDNVGETRKSQIPKQMTKKDKEDEASEIQKLQKKLKELESNQEAHINDAIAKKFSEISKSFGK